MMARKFDCFIYMRQGQVVVGNKHEQLKPDCSSRVTYTTRNSVMIYAPDNMEFHGIFSELCRRSENTADAPAG